MRDMLISSNDATRLSRSMLHMRYDQLEAGRKSAAFTTPTNHDHQAVPSRAVPSAAKCYRSKLVSLRHSSEGSKDKTLHRGLCMCY